MCVCVFRGVINAEKSSIEHFKNPIFWIKSFIFHTKLTHTNMWEGAEKSTSPYQSVTQPKVYLSRGIAVEAQS